MKFDLHTHHQRCGHASGEIEDYIKAAVKAGLDVIGISDHTPYFGEEEDHAVPRIAMPKSSFSAYVREVLQLKKFYENRIEVLLGVEADFFRAHQQAYNRELSRYPFDYIIGSVHYTGGKSIFDKTRWEGVDEAERLRVKEAYYDLIADSARSSNYQVLGHIDAIKGFCPNISTIRTQKVEETLKTIGENDVAIEINTSGKNKDCGGWYPSTEILERALFYGIPVTFGSDSHVPERVGDDFEAVRDHLKAIGYKEWRFFRQKKPVIVPL